MGYKNILVNESIFVEMKENGHKKEWVYGLRNPYVRYGHLVTVSGAIVYHRVVSGLNAFVSGGSLFINT